ncbi:MAG: hypothetical protein M1554_02525 [Patescibacteria group bacterium]|jgi:hypothetical protein|nr:hypothetical protein [Patescibacteria group bacterium]
MSSKKFHILMIALFCFSVLIFVGLTYESNNFFQNDAIGTNNLKAKLASLTQEQISLLQDKSDIKKYTPLFEIASSIVPQNKDQAEAVRQIINLATANNVVIGSITFPTSTLGNLLPDTGVAPPASAIKAAPSPANSASLSQLTPVPNLPGIYELPITIQSSTQSDQETTYPELINFLSALENNRLTALVSTISITPNPANPNLFSFSLSINIYIKPGV